MGKITWTKKRSTSFEDLSNPDVRERLRRDAERAAREEQRRRLARRQAATMKRA